MQDLVSTDRLCDRLKGKRSFLAQRFCSCSEPVASVLKPTRSVCSPDRLPTSGCAFLLRRKRKDRFAGLTIRRYGSHLLCARSCGDWVVRDGACEGLCDDFQTLFNCYFTRKVMSRLLNKKEMALECW